MAPPQRRRSLGPVSPKRIYRSLSLKLKGGASQSEAEPSDWRRRLSRGPAEYSCLWDALENEDTLAVQHLLSRERDGRVNAVSELGLVPLDVAALTHNAPLLQVLVKAGAKHNPTLSSAFDWSLKLDELVSLAEQKLEEWRAELLLRVKAEFQSQTDVQKNVDLWTRRQELYCRMRDRFHTTAPPGPPAGATLLVMSDSCLCVQVTEPAGQAHGLITRYRVEWSSLSCFHPLCGTGFITDTRNPEFSITGLQTGVQYYVRVSAYNVRGWGSFVSSSPPCIAPSSWSSCCGVTVRRRNPAAAVRRISQQIREPTLSESRSSVKRVSVSRGLKQLFHSSRFVRLLQRGVYLASVFYQKDCVLVTADDQLPLVEIQSCSTSVTQDFLWFCKLSCAWMQVPRLLQVLSSSSLSSSSSLLQNRLSFLRAVAQLQASVGCVDLGQVYFEPLKDRQGNMLLVTLREATTPLPPSDPPLRWLPVSNLERNQSETPLLPEPSAVELLTHRLKEMLAYHRRSQQRAQPGLYVGILKLCSSVNQLRILVPQRLPNMPCHCRVRNRPHVSREEWAWLQEHAVGGACGSQEGGDDAVIDSSGVEDFVKALRSAVTQLLTKLNVPLERASEYRVYTQELLQVGDQVSVILLLPPCEEFRSRQRPAEGAQHTFTVPMHYFELVHLWAYERDLLSQYCQLWLRLELDVRLSQQALREALDTEELQEATERLAHVTQLAQSLSALWSESRWLMDVIQTLRSKHSEGAVPLGRVMTSRPSIRSAANEDTPPALHTLEQMQTAEVMGSEVSAPVEVTDGVTCPETPTSHYTDEPRSHGNSTRRHGNSLRQMHSCPELSDPAASHPVMPADEGQELLTEMMDLFQSLDLLGGSLADLQELDWSDPEPDLQNQDQDDRTGATDSAVTHRGHPVRSLVEWVKSTV
ncbi:ankyrin repeat and fibronectin type-III domain-containing protein 1-like isoform X1 [Cyprinus carpio]|uniref:Ankyrin repeat and fibronectin type-III domain-containing protein 1-like isoform X1 n=2 Tax=Cyprinus carpio TaxID=7962 RepID=A0A9Q9W1Y9_CYPCA|nr:ankyrin repeat and fibronectin type-III domain-containing protein 1-like isoform X1 [Cyprinus carpio]XP_042575345.1 ankyrin repeat and fibronectin type-III domain-containing protein 1-like isoform X1 [Cyprinus carpio]